MVASARYDTAFRLMCITLYILKVCKAADAVDDCVTCVIIGLDDMACSNSLREQIINEMLGCDDFDLGKEKSMIVFIFEKLY